MRSQELERIQDAGEEWDSGYRRVIAWQKADDLFAAIYKLADAIPKRDWWLRSQLLAAARSVSANIAEGHGRGTVRDYVRFLEMSLSSLNEVQNDLHILERNEIVNPERVSSMKPLRIETRKVLAGLLRAMRNKLPADANWQRKLSEEHDEYRAEVRPEPDFYYEDLTPDS